MQTESNVAQFPLLVLHFSLPLPSQHGHANESVQLVTYGVRGATSTLSPPTPRPTSPLRGVQGTMASWCDSTPTMMNRCLPSPVLFTVARRPGRRRTASRAERYEGRQRVWAASGREPFVRSFVTYTLHAVQLAEANVSLCVFYSTDNKTNKNFGARARSQRPAGRRAPAQETQGNAGGIESHSE